MKVLIVDDEPIIRLGLSKFISSLQWEPFAAGTGAEAVEIADAHGPDAAVVDLKLPDMNGLEVLRAIKKTHPGCAVIMLTAWASVSDAVEAIKQGAEQYLTKPADLAELEVHLRRIDERQKLREQAEFFQSRGEWKLVGASAAMKSLRSLVEMVAANSQTTVLVLGESGVGKEVVARNIHMESARAAKPFIDINCAGLSPTLLESELFGYEKGAFTDAKMQKKGLFEIANGGTIFLDEIGEMDLGIQAKLLRVLQTRTFRRVGGRTDIEVDVRVVAATNRDLAKMAAEGTFRSDLFYRLNVFPVTVPPLRARPDDIAVLAEFFLHQLHSGGAKPIAGFSEEALAALKQYAWPGNVRELRNIVERAVILCKGGLIMADHIAVEQAAGAAKRKTPDHGLATLEEVESAHIAQTLKRQGGNVSQTAKILGISRSTLHVKLKKYGIEFRE